MCGERFGATGMGHHFFASTPEEYEAQMMLKPRDVEFVEARERMDREVYRSIGVAGRPPFEGRMGP